jgi:hypothetical protein
MHAVGIIYHSSFLSCVVCQLFWYYSFSLQSGYFLSITFNILHVDVHCEFSMPSNSLSCSPAQALYTLTWQNQCLFRTIADVRTGDLLGLYMSENVVFLSFFPSSDGIFYTFISERDCPPLQRFYKGFIQSNQQLAHSRLMHSVYSGSTALQNAWNKSDTRDFNMLRGTA